MTKKQLIEKIRRIINEERVNNTHQSESLQESDKGIRARTNLKKQAMGIYTSKFDYKRVIEKSSGRYGKIKNTIYKPGTSTAIAVQIEFDDDPGVLKTSSISQLKSKFNLI